MLNDVNIHKVAECDVLTIVAKDEHFFSQKMTYPLSQLSLHFEVKHIMANV